MTDYRTESEVRRIASELRKQHAALDWSATVDDLIRLQGFDQALIPRRPFSFDEWMKEANSKERVQALVSLKEKVILVASDLHSRRVPFAKAHEVGHIALPWHREILYVCDEHDLSQGTRSQMEFEANTFASELLLPKELLEPYFSTLPTSFDTILQIQERSGASIEVSAYAYVRNHPGVCALLVLSEVPEDLAAAIPAPAHLKLVRKSLSRKAVATDLGLLTHGQTFNSDHVLFQASRSVGDVGRCDLTMKTTGRPYSATVVNNTYKIFALIAG